MDHPDVKEGFICPVCMQDLLSIADLQTHFNNAHSQEDKLIKQSLKDFIGKAKQCIKQELSDSPAPQVAYKYHPSHRAEQDIGVVTSHLALFKSVRDDRVDHLSTETNKLIIRLDKLFTRLPSDPVKRKAHERSVVAWVEEDTIGLCPDCGRQFGILRRKHHCRLCGFVLCGRCSAFISASRAQKLAPPTPGGAVSLAQLAPRLGGVVPSLASLRRSGSLGSLNSAMAMVDAVTGEPQLRICCHCDQKLALREEQVEQQNSEPILVQFYSQLREMQQEIRHLIPMHNKMLESLLAGESKYHLSDANTLRIKILKTAERVDDMCKRIGRLGADEGEVSPWRQQLQSRVRFAATTFLKEDVISLPQLPTEQQLSKLQARFREETQLRVAEEQEIVARNAERQHTSEMAGLKRWTSLSSHKTQYSHKPTGEVAYLDAWTPPVGAVPAADDPLLQQMEIVRGYIRQARDSNKYDELAIFERNLRDLETEYRQSADQQGSA